MSCKIDLKAYVVGEVTRPEQAAVEDHVRGCQSCRDELDRLTLMRSTLASLQDEDIPRRIAFVSDQVFEPRWWQTIWHSGPVMGFASAVLLAVAVLAHGFARSPVVDSAQIEKQIESRVNARVEAAVNQAQAKQAAQFAQLLNATETRFEAQRRADLASFQQVDEYRQKQMSRLLVASNEEYKQ